MLGVYIVRYQGGPTSLYGGDAKWNTVILDLRNDFMNLSNNQDIEEFYPVIASDLGICVGVVRMLPGSRLMIISLRGCSFPKGHLFLAKSCMIN